MNIRFKIELIEEGPKASLYTIKLKDSELSEFEKFITNQEVNKNSEFQPLILRLRELSEKYGCQERFFKLSEGAFIDSLVALWRGNIRLYCCRYSNVLLVLGSGGIKKTKTYQEDSKLNNIVKIMTEVSKRIDDRIIHEKTLKIIGTKFVGNLNFE